MWEMVAQYAEQIKCRNPFKKLLALFQLQIDDLSAKPCQPITCTINLLALLAYYMASVVLLWADNNSALISTLLNALCVLRGFCKVIFNQKIYRARVHNSWVNCTKETEDFIRKVCNPYSRMYVLELVTLIVVSVMLVAIICYPGVYPITLIGTLILGVAFLGDCVDVFSDMYQAHPPMPDIARENT